MWDRFAMTVLIDPSTALRMTRGTLRMTVCALGMTSCALRMTGGKRGEGVGGMGRMGRYGRGAWGGACGRTGVLAGRPPLPSGSAFGEVYLWEIGWGCGLRGTGWQEYGIGSRWLFYRFFGCAQNDIVTRGRRGTQGVAPGLRLLRFARNDNVGGGRHGGGGEGARGAAAERRRLTTACWGWLRCDGAGAHGRARTGTD
jgi:hypothetical protein